MEKFYSVSGLAKKLNVTSTTIYNWIKAKKLDVIKVDYGSKKGYVIKYKEE